MFSCTLFRKTGVDGKPAGKGGSHESIIRNEQFRKSGHAIENVRGHAGCLDGDPDCGHALGFEGVELH